jgi:hypothetical protein
MARRAEAMMLTLHGRGGCLCDGWTRREVLRVAGLGTGAAGLSLAHLLAAESARAGASTASESSFGRARSCIVLFLMGGPPQHSTWDPKPDAPAEVRGPFAPIATAVPGLSLCELMPGLARVADRLCLLRSVSTDDNAHSSSGYYMLTGRPHTPKNVENANPGAPNDAPTLGALVGRFLPPRGGLPQAVRLPHRIANTDGSVWPGQDAGLLGRAADPWLLNAQPTADGLLVEEVALPADLDALRVGRRRAILDGMAARLDRLASDPTAVRLDEHARRAYAILASPAARAAFELRREDPKARDRYGHSPFGEGVLLARRLVEAGARLVQVNWYRGPDEPDANPCWDSHVNEPERLRDVLVPPMDRAFSALVDDLAQRGLLDETLVVAMAEFGRAPRLDPNGGRGHWGHVFSVALAGGGVRGGTVHGASDKLGAYPREGLVRPEDLSATILHLLGIDPAAEYRDPLGRPQPAARGRVIDSILV